MAVQGYNLEQTGQEVQGALNKIISLSPATEEAPGLMSAEDKTKLNGITPANFATKDELASKVDKETGKGLSTNDFTDAEKAKLGGVEAGAQANVLETIKVNGTPQTPVNKAVDIDTKRQLVLKGIPAPGEYDTTTFEQNYCSMADLSKAARGEYGAARYSYFSGNSSSSEVYPVAGKSETVFTVEEKTVYLLMGASARRIYHSGSGNVVVTNTSIPTALSQLSEDTTHRVVTDAEKALWSGKADKVSNPTSGNLAGLDSNGNITDSGKKASDFATAAQGAKADTAIQDLSPITDLIPAQASDQNQLADKAFVNSSIATATATFRGAYNLVTDLSLTVSATQSQIATALGTAISTADNNDYAFVQVPTADVTPTEIAQVERYKYNGSAWAFEYALNNSGFTASQWAALNSGITSGLVGKLSALPTNSELTTLLAGKQDTISDLAAIRTGAGLGATAYQKPSTGIPASDLASGVIPDVSGKENTSNKVTSLSAQSTDTQYPSAKATYDAINPSVQSSQPQGGFEPNVVYDLGELTGNVTFTLAAGVTGKVNAYHWTFDTGSTAPTITWPSGIIWPDGFTPSVDANKHYEVLVRNGYASMLSYSLS